jgi:hypothetical protein
MGARKEKKVGFQVLGLGGVCIYFKAVVGAKYVSSAIKPDKRKLLSGNLLEVSRGRIGRRKHRTEGNKKPALKDVSRNYWVCGGGKKREEGRAGT